MSDINNMNIDAILEAYDKHAYVSAEVLESTGMGFMVGLFGLQCFLPGSETVDKEHVQVGDTIEVMVLKINAGKANVIVSNKAVVNARADELVQKTLDDLHEGEIVQGIVKSVTPYGAFVTVGGLDGLLHMNEMSWKKISSPAEVVKPGDVVNVKVVSIEEKKGKTMVTFSLKQCTPDPWTLMNPDDYIGQVLEGTVVLVTNYGVFLDLGEVEGLIHDSELDWGESKKSKELFSVGDKVTAKVIMVDHNERKMALSIRALRPDPWDSVTDDILGQDFELPITKVVKFGVFVKFPSGIEGLVHISALSWAKIDNPGDEFAVGDIISVRVVDIDKSKKKMLLSHKVLVHNPWETMDVNNYIGKVYEGRVQKVSKDGIYVRFAPELVGRVGVHEIPKDFVGNMAAFCNVGDMLRVSPHFIDVRSKTIWLNLA